MKESIGYTVTLNIMIIFITIIVAFFWAALIYFKSNKVSNIITTGIEKYEEFGTLAVAEISKRLENIGYGSHSIESDCTKQENLIVSDKGAYNGECTLINDNEARGKNGYCVYVCYQEDAFGEKEDGETVYQGEYYYYKIRTNMMIGVPILNDVLDIPIYSNTNRLYNFDKEV